MSDAELTKIYIVVGIMVVSNLATIIGVIVGLMKMVWWLSAFKTKTDTLLEEHEKDINEAHKKLRTLEKRAMNI